MFVTGLFALLLGVALLYYAFSSYFVFAFFANPKEDPVDSPGAWPPVSILKPVAGLDPGYAENFASFCLQEYPEYEVVFAASDENDPAIPLVRELSERYGDRIVRWAIAEGNEGPNYKVGNLIAAASAARHDTLVISDSDIRVDPDYLKRTVGALRREGVGLVTALYRSTNIRNVPSALQGLTVQTTFIPNVLLGRRLEGVSYAFGSTIATTRALLGRIGGLEALLDFLADDYQLGNRVHNEGRAVEISPGMVDHVSNLRSLRAYLSHQLRWAITQKASRPAGYVLSVFTHGVPLATLFALLDELSAVSLGLLALTCGARLGSSALLNWAVFRNAELKRYLWLVPANDILNTALWLLSLLAGTVRWRQRRFRVLRGGRMVELRAEKRTGSTRRSS